MRGWLGFTAMLVVAVVVGPARGDDPVKVKESKAPIAAAEAKDHVGETLTVALTVKHAKDGTHEESIFLDSESDYNDPNNLAIVIKYEARDAFKKAGIADLVAHYDGKAIKVTGKIVKEGKQTRIRVSEPGQIEVVAKTP